MSYAMLATKRSVGIFSLISLLVRYEDLTLFAKAIAFKTIIIKFKPHIANDFIADDLHKFAKYLKNAYPKARFYRVIILYQICQEIYAGFDVDFTIKLTSHFAKQGNRWKS